MPRAEAQRSPEPDIEELPDEPHRPTARRGRRAEPGKNAARASTAEQEEAPAPTRIAPRPHDPRTGAEIGPHEVVKGFQTEAGQLVTITPEEMRTLDVVEDTRALDLATFVLQSELAPLYFETPYFLHPDGENALKRTGSSLPRWRKPVRQASTA